MSYMLYCCSDRGLGPGKTIQDGADAVEEAINFAHEHREGLALLHQPDFPRSNWTMFKWSEMHQNVVPISVKVN